MRELTLAKLSFIFNKDDADAFDMDKPLLITDAEGIIYELADVCSQGISLLYNNMTDKRDGIYIRKTDSSRILDEMTENLLKNNNVEVSI